MIWNDHEYYRLRARQEEAAADRAVCDAARQRHLELAALYDQRLHGDSTQAPRAVAVIPLCLARPITSEPEPLVLAGISAKIN